MAGFSSVLKLADLDDFINPSQECIIPVQRPKIVPQSSSSSKIKIELEDDGTYMQVKEGSKVPLEKVQITLSDCLACSGCITSAESVLVSQQSPDEMFRVLDNNRNSEATKAVVSLSVQAVLSIANKYELNCQETAERLAGLFMELGADTTTTVTLAENMALLESAKEFLTAYQNKTMPVLTGLCPGWVCYSEKLHPLAIPKISKVKSPQQIMGSLIKLHYGSVIGVAPSEIYHVTLMPCFDRKLEASRKDFFLEEYNTKEVDVVITPIEIEQIFEKLEKSIMDFDRVKLSDLFLNSGKTPEIGYQVMSRIGSGSGGYAEFVLRTASLNLFGKDLDTITWETGRNPDIQEYTLRNDDGAPLLKFCIATGFRNIQTLVRKLKTKTPLPSYVEIMACPTGCLNGGAQVRPADSQPSRSRELSTKLEKSYHELPEVDDFGNSKSIYDQLLKNKPLFNHVMYTEYHKIDIVNAGIKW